MEVKKINLQGLNYSVSDRQAIAGVCRELENLYPSGDPGDPLWLPAHKHEEYYKVTGPLPQPFDDATIEGVYPIDDVYPWHRSNKQSVLVYLRFNPITGEDYLCGREIDDKGNIVVASAEEVYYIFPHSNSNQVSFAQISDQLFVCIARNEQPYELLQLFETETGTMCLPYNPPDCPFCRVMQTLISSEKTEFSGLVGFIFAWELFDGTITSPTQIKFADIKPADGFIKVRLSKTSVDAKWKNLIRGVAIFMTKSVVSIDKFLTEQMIFKHVGILEKIFDADQEYIVTLTMDEFVANTQIFDTDILLSGKVMPRLIFTYNKQLILADVTLGYAKPLMANGTLSSAVDGGGGGLPDDKGIKKIKNLVRTPSRDPSNYFIYNKSDFTWDLPEKATGVVIKRRVYLKYTKWDGQSTYTYYADEYVGAALSESQLVGWNQVGQALTSFSDTVVMPDSVQLVTLTGTKVHENDRIVTLEISYAFAPTFADGTIGDYTQSDLGGVVPGRSRG